MRSIHHYVRLDRGDSVTADTEDDSLVLRFGADDGDTVTTVTIAGTADQRGDLLGQLADLRGLTGVEAGR